MPDLVDFNSTLWIAHYAPATRRLAYKYQPLEGPQQRRDHHEAAAYDFLVQSELPGVFNPDRAFDPIDFEKRCQLDGEKEIHVSPGQYLVWSGGKYWSANDYVAFSADEFAEHFIADPACNSCFEIIGPVEKVGVTEDYRLVRENGQIIEDPISFMRGKIRMAEDVTMPADASLSLQGITTKLYARDVDHRTGSVHIAHLLVVAHYVRSHLWQLSDMGNADYTCFLELDELVDEWMQDEPDSMADLVTDLLDAMIGVADSCTSHPALVEFAKDTGLGRALFQPVENIESMEDLDIEIAKLTASWDLPLEIPEHAMAAALDLTSISTGDDRNSLRALESFFFRGEIKAHGKTIDGHNVEIVDYQGITFVTLTQPGDTKEIVCWPTQPQRLFEPKLEHPKAGDIIH